MATKPNNYLNWTPDGSPAKVSKPPTSISDAGWTRGQPPGYQFVNYQMYLLDQWVQYLDQTTVSTAASNNANANLRLIRGGLWSYVAATNTLAWASAFNIAALGVADASNQAAAGSVVIPDGSVAYVNANIPFSTTGNSTNGSTSITNLAYPGGIVAGQSITGNGIPNGTIVLSVVGSSITISAAATDTATGVGFTFVGSGALTVQVAPVASIVPTPTTVVIARAVGALVYVGVGSGQMNLRDGEQKFLSSPGYLTLSSFTAGQALAIRTPVYVSAGGADGSNLSSNTTSADVTVTVPSTTGLQVGNGVSGAGIPGGTTIATIVNGTTLTLSAAATATQIGVSLLYSRTVGKIYPCDSSVTFGTVRSGFMGLTVAAAVQDASVQVVGDGSLYGFSGLTPGGIYYVDPTTPGALTSIKPSTANQYVIPVGVAINTTALAINGARQATVAPVQTLLVPGGNYGVTSTAQLQTAIAMAAISGGSIVVLAPFVLTASVTLPPYVILEGRKLGASITVSSNVSITLSDGCEVRNVSFIVSPGVTTPIVIVPSNFTLTRNNLFQLPVSGAIGMSYSGSSNRTYNSFFSGVMAPGATSVGIAYTGGTSNIGESNIFTA